MTVWQVGDAKPAPSYQDLTAENERLKAERVQATLLWSDALAREDALTAQLARLKEPLNEEEAIDFLTMVRSNIATLGSDAVFRRAFEAVMKGRVG